MASHPDFVNYMAEQLREAGAAFPDLPKAPPYEGARDSFLVEDVENREQMTELVRITCEALRSGPQRKRRK